VSSWVCMAPEHQAVRRRAVQAEYCTNGGAPQALSARCLQLPDRPPFLLPRSLSFFDQQGGQHDPQQAACPTAVASAWASGCWGEPAGRQPAPAAPPGCSWAAVSRCGEQRPPTAAADAPTQQKTVIDSAAAPMRPQARPRRLWRHPAAVVHAASAVLCMCVLPHEHSSIFGLIEAHGSRRPPDANAPCLRMQTPHTRSWPCPRCRPQ
jgi:hypothetical protein